MTAAVLSSPVRHHLPPFWMRTISDYPYVLGGGQVLMADTPAHLTASEELTESFSGTAPQIPQTPK